MPEGREKITLVEPGQPYQDPETGQEKTGGPTYHKVYAERTNRVGVEAAGAFQFTATAPVLFEVRRQTSIASCDPLWSARQGWVETDAAAAAAAGYNILSARESTGRKKTLELVCIEDAVRS